MTRLTDTQLLILTAAAQGHDGNVLPLPGSLRGGAAAKVVGALLSRGLVAEQVTDSVAKADPALNTFWRNDDDGRAVLLRITAEGLAAIGVDVPDSAPETAGGAPTEAEANDAPADVSTASTTPKTREGTKQAELIAMLRKGATIGGMVAAFGIRHIIPMPGLCRCRLKRLNSVKSVASGSA
jgi:hypothetical protein